MATQIPEAPQVPALGSSTFEDDMRNFHTWEKEQLQPNINLIATEVENNKNTVEIIKNEVEQYKNETLQAKNDTEQYKNETLQIKDEILEISNNLGYKGQWNSNTVYSIGDCVTYNNDFWVSTQDNNQNNIPGTNDFWMSTINYKKIMLYSIIFG